jgi:hypothetical protein
MSFRRNLVKHWQNPTYKLSTFHLGFNFSIKTYFLSLVESFKIDKFVAKGTFLQTFLSANTVFWDW